MFAKAAASASVPIVKGGVYLDSYDVKLIQYRTAINKLTEIVRILKILENSLNRKNETRDIIPLLNYILALCQGPAYNVSQPLRKRLRLLSEFKLCKLGDVNPTVNISPIDLSLELPEVIDNFEEYKAKVYDLELQGKLLNSILKVSQNALLIYDQKFRQCTMERNASRPTDMSGRPITLEEKCFEELIQPVEIAVALDLAVLINDFEIDTSSKSFRKLSLQVLMKFKDYMSDKAIPTIKTYHTSLFRFARTKPLSQAKVIMNLPYWQYTMHRIYAMLLRIKYLLDVIKTLTRQIYIPNKMFFLDPSTQLLAENVFEYQELQKDLDELCSTADNTSVMTEDLEAYSKQGTMFAVQPTNILNAYNNSVAPAVQLLRTHMQTVNSWVSMWKFINGNSSVAATIQEVELADLGKMLEERLAVDKLDSLEKQKQKELVKRQKSDIINGGAPNGNVVKTIFRRSSLRRSSISSNSSESSSPGNLSPAKLSRSSSHEMKRLPTTLKTHSRNGSGISSPLVSRRGSVSDRASRSPATKVASERSPQMSRTVTHTKEGSNRSIGRKRSASLQSAAETPKSISNIEKERSNSLQANAALNRRMVQNTLLHLSGDLSGKGLAKNEVRSNRFSNSSATSNKLLRSDSSSPLRHKNLATRKHLASSDDNDVPNIESLTIEEEIAKGFDIDASATSEDITGEEISASSSKDENDEEIDGSIFNSNASTKRVRFTGVPPMSNAENPRPKRKGWYKKPAILNYPPPPPLVAIQQLKLRQEGLAFRTSLREAAQDSGQQKKTSLSNPNDSQPSGHKFTNKIRDKLIR